MEHVTLNDFIKSLQDLTEEHGNDDLLAVGACCGNYKGLASPFSVHLKSESGDITVYVRAYKD